MAPVGCSGVHRTRPWLPPGVLAVLLIGLLLVPSGPASALGPTATDQAASGPSARVPNHGPPAADLVAAVTAAYPGGGTLAVAVARQPAPFAWVSTRAAEARAVRVAGYADNGAAAER